VLGRILPGHVAGPGHRGDGRVDRPHSR
jgi:hypothetical protein